MNETGREDEDQVVGGSGAADGPAEEEGMLKADDWGWTGELDATTIQGIAPISLELWRSGNQWVNRRVESIELLDVSTMRIHCSIDFRVPTALPGSVELGGRQTYFLPLAVLQRRVNQAYFDVRDETGAALPLLTRQENARLTGAILTTAAKRALKQADIELPLGEILSAYLAKIPTKGASEAKFFVSGVLDPTDRTVYPEKDAGLGEALLSDREFRDLLGICYSSSFIHIPLPTEPGERRIVKFSMVSPWSDPPGSRAESDDSERRRRMAVWLGAAPEVAYHGFPQIGNCESFHIQIGAPERVEFTSAGVVHAPSAEMTEELAEKAPSYAELDRPAGDPVKQEKVVVGGVAKRKHIYIDGADAHRSGWIWVSIRIVRHGFLRASVSLAWLTSFLMILFSFRAKNILGEEQTAAAVLLLVPALIAGFLVSPGEHALTRRLLRGPRFLTACVGGLALIAIAALLTLPGSGPDPSVPACLYWTWGIEAVASLVISILLTVAFISASSAADPPAEGAASVASGDDGNV